MLGLRFHNLDLFPHLFPRFGFATPLLWASSWLWPPPRHDLGKFAAVSFMQQAGRPLVRPAGSLARAPPPPMSNAGTRTKVSSGLGLQRLRLFNPPSPLPVAGQVNPPRATRETVRPCGLNYPHLDPLGSTFNGGGQAMGTGRPAPSHWRGPPGRARHRACTGHRAPHQVTGWACVCRRAPHRQAGRTGCIAGSGSAPGKGQVIEPKAGEQTG